MVNPVQTILFDVLLVGSALWVLAAMVAEAVRGRRPEVGTRQGVRCNAAVSRQKRALRHSRGQVVGQRRAA